MDSGVSATALRILVTAREQALPSVRSARAFNRLIFAVAVVFMISLFLFIFVVGAIGLCGSEILRIEAFLELIERPFLRLRPTHYRFEFGVLDCRFESVGACGQQCRPRRLGGRLHLLRHM